jgi:hypothetical protein
MDDALSAAPVAPVAPPQPPPTAVGALSPDERAEFVAYLERRLGDQALVLKEIVAEVLKDNEARADGFRQMRETIRMQTAQIADLEAKYQRLSNIIARANLRAQ